MAIWEFYIIFIFGLMSSLHCVQMCGPIVLAFSLPLSASRRPKKQLVLAQMAYNIGRIVTYSLLGALAGALGGTINLTGRLAGVENIAAIITGALMILAGLLLLDLLPARSWQKLDPLRLVSRLLRPLGRHITSPSVASKFALGLALGFLPCGLIYAALLMAVASGGAVAGALTMSSFGLGTVSALMLIGLFSSALSFRFNRWGTWLAAISILLLGVVILARGTMPMTASHAESKDAPLQSSHQHRTPGN